MLQICPTDFVQAPMGRVWTLLTSDYTSWADARLASREPDGPAVPRQRIHLTTSALGLRGRLLERLISGAGERSVADSLRRLKRVAETLAAS